MQFETSLKIKYKTHCKDFKTGKYNTRLTIILFLQLTIKFIE